jgi:hypothetical protein
MDVTSIAEASHFYSSARDMSDEGASTWPHGQIIDGGKVVAYISYNGKVWADDPCRRDWETGAAPLFNPYI